MTKKLTMTKKLLGIMAILCVLSLVGCSSSKEAPTQAQQDTTSAGREETPSQVEPMRVVSMKGPTSIGLVNLMDAEEENAEKSYEFTMITAADEAVAQIVNGSADVALIPANLAATLYAKTDGKVTVLNINTLGVIYLVQVGDELTSIKELEGKTIYVTGKGTTPDLALQYILKGNGISLDAVTLEYKSEAAEVVEALAQNPAGIGLLPQPFVTVAMSKNENLKIAFDLTKEWDNLQGENGSTLVTGVTVVRNEYLETNKEQVEGFLSAFQASVEKANSDVEATSLLVEKYDIVNAAVAKKAIPMCNITYIAGEEMKEKLSGYLQVLFELEPKSIGGAVPGDEFYFK